MDRGRFGGRRRDFSQFGIEAGSDHRDAHILARGRIDDHPEDDAHTDDGQERDVHDFCCGDCLRRTVERATYEAGRRIACPRCGGHGDCQVCEGGLIFQRPDVAKKVGATNPATTSAEVK